MAGIYIHIPFCKKKCYYCDFYTSPQIKNISTFVEKIIIELETRKNYLDNEKVETIYFGGGTPSLLSFSELNKILNAIYTNFEVSENPEITLEANPDDITETYVENLQKTDINRFSIGIQSFFDDDLKLMNRRHNSEEAIKSIKLLQTANYYNISGDLIYGLPKMNGEKWKGNLTLFFELEIPHLSAYHLSYEPNTVFNKYLKTKKIIPVSEEKSEEFFTILLEKSSEKKFVQYEISSFAKKGYFSRHNSSYWQQKKYLGVGPSAHSYNKKERRWNDKNLQKYMNRVGEGQGFYSVENLTLTDNYNDYLITSLRTIWGINFDYIKSNFGEKYFDFCNKNSQKYIISKHLNFSNKILTLSDKGKFISDKIIEDLFFV